MAKSYRIERLNDAIKELLSELIFRRIKDPRIGFITITAVRTAPDMTSAKVFYSVMGSPEDKLATLQGLKSAQAFLRKTIGKELRLRHAPELRFIYDDSLDKALAIEAALDEIEKKKNESS
jgi:ribosome-binding factor A